MLPSEIRIQHIILNDNKFRDIFNCPEGAAMLVLYTDPIPFPLEDIEDDDSDYQD